MKRLALLLACAVLAGCGTVRTMQIKVPVPVACNEAVPARPSMPTELLRSDTADEFDLFISALAEIDIREAYEVLMRAALVACTKPLK